jgi:hypothetical protein
MQMLKKLDVSKATLANIFLETRALREFSAEVAGGSCWPENGLASLTGQTPPMRTNSVGCVSSYEPSRWIWSQLGLDERPLLARSGHSIAGGKVAGAAVTKRERRVPSVLHQRT